MVVEEETAVKEEKPAWTGLELKLESYRQSQCKEEDGNLLKGIIQQRMEESFLRDFLFHMNSRQLQEEHVQRDILDRLRFDIAAGLKESIELEREGGANLCEDVLGLIEGLLHGNPSGTITIRGALSTMDVLRMTGTKEQAMDKSLRFSEPLRCLILAGCCVRDFPGELLPKQLMMLELYCNQLERIDLLMSSCPQNILYLGLGRNYLTQDVLGPLSNLECLLHLDLSDNDIEDVTIVADICKPLTSLSSLILQGNPCSYEMYYSRIIGTCLPTLFFLDGEVLKRSNNNAIINKESKENTSIRTLSGALHISLIRLMSFPQPKNEKINKKKVSHTFRLEVLCPLLLKYLPENTESFVELRSPSIKKEENLAYQKKNQSSIKTLKEKETLTKHTSKSGEHDSNGKRVKNEQSSSENQNLHEDLTKHFDTIGEELKEQLDGKLRFLSERKKWSKIIEFSQPTIEIPHCNLFTMRNVFRSKIIIYVTHLKTLPPAKAKSSKKKKGEKSMEDDKIVDMKDANKEILVSKTVVAKLEIPLRSIAWNEQSLDYSWSQPYPTRVVEEKSLKVSSDELIDEAMAEEQTNLPTVSEARASLLSAGVARSHLRLQAKAGLRRKAYRTANMWQKRSTRNQRREIKRKIRWSYKSQKNSQSMLA